MGGAGARLRAVLGVRSAGPRGAWPAEAPDADALAEGFRARFGEAPAGVWHAPGRLAVMGEHTAAAGGVGLYTALPWGVTAAVGPAPGPEVRVATLSGPLRARETAARAVSDAVASARRAGGLDASTGLRVLLGADLPEHASLGYAGAVGAAVSLALADLGGGPPPEGATVDQRVALAARPGCAVRVNLRSMRTTVLPFDLAGEGMRLVVVDTGALPRRDLRAVRSAELERAQRTLGPLRSVQDLPGALRSLPEPALRNRVEYAVTEVHRLNAAVGLLRAGRFGETGPILSASHLSLRRFGLPTPQVDLAAETASRAGARGVRMSGWAGTALALVAGERVEGVATALAGEFAASGWVPPRVRASLPSAGAHRLR
ncbi:galactokinase family protein [Nocardiopsis tropica]|uniref:Galactokinase family protein n=1 Tax=Nocardiopsis tropica TaxID=109330 RepID=A0ABU7KM35_9ACTN|nr:galactokinase family protein [Nocardiopsis umidischolae]MEE2050366.1 galactokinase family protein [Nocardiopsis umidischolae]